MIADSPLLAWMQRVAPTAGRAPGTIVIAMAMQLIAARRLRYGSLNVSPVIIDDTYQLRSYARHTRGKLWESFESLPVRQALRA